MFSDRSGYFINIIETVAYEVHNPKYGGEFMKNKKMSHNNSGGGAYALGLIGSAVYYVQQSDGFWPIIGALLKAIVWPAFVVYDLLKFIG